MQTDQPIPARRVDLAFIKKKNTYDTVDFAVLLDHRMEIKGRRKVWILPESRKKDLKYEDGDIYRR